jgi:hypothetical protein
MRKQEGLSWIRCHSWILRCYVALGHYIKPNEQEMLDATTLLEIFCAKSSGERMQ